MCADSVPVPARSGAVPALAEETAGDEVTRSDFSLSLLMHADGFPNDGAAHYATGKPFFPS